MDNLQAYESSSDEEDNTDRTQNRKRNSSTVSEEHSKKARLVLPEAIQAMFSSPDSADSHRDDPSLHGNRLRTFAHERGNWASYVCIKFEAQEEMLELVSNLIGCVPSCDLKPMNDLHISLSRTFVARHHWIEPLVQSLRNNLKLCSKCFTDLESTQVYTNDEKTRTFLSIAVGANQDIMRSYVTAVDRALLEYKLPVYYEEPSFHMSVAWATGDVSTNIGDAEHREMSDVMEEFFESSPNLSVIEIKELYLKAGNKTFVLPLG